LFFSEVQDIRILVHVESDLPRLSPSSSFFTAAFSVLDWIDGAAVFAPHNRQNTISRNPQRNPQQRCNPEMAVSLRLLYQYTDICVEMGEKERERESQ
jgi:hypothetical protein